MATYFEIPLASPLKPIWQNKKLPSDTGTVFYYNPAISYNRKSYDNSFFYDSLTSFDEKTSYCQKFQQSDTVRLPFLGIDDLTGYQNARLLDVNGNVYASKTVTVAQEAGTWSGLKLYTITMHLYDVQEGKYFLQLRWKSNNAYVHCLFEPIHVKQIHPNTIRIEYYNTYNDQSMIYPASTFIPQVRVEGCITDIQPEAKFNNYENQPLDTEFVSGVPYRMFELNIGYGKRGIPEWMADKINRITLTTDLTIDGKAYTRNEGSKLEGGNSNGLPLSQYKLKLRETENVSTLVINAHATVSGGTTTFGTVIGDMPQTMYFYIENIEINGQTVVVQKGFAGKRNFLDYLNATRMVGQGHFYEDDNLKLVYLHYASAIATSFSLTAANVLKYGIRFDTVGAADFEFYLTSTSGNYALVKNATTITTKTASNGVSPAISGMTGNNSVYLYMDTVTSVTDTASTGIFMSIGGDLPADIDSFDMSQGNGINYVQNNMFRYVTIIKKIFLTNQSIGRYGIDDLIRWIYDSRAGLSGTCEIDLQQNPPASPSNEVLQFKAVVEPLVLSYITN